MASRYNSERYYSPTEYEAFTRIEREERDAARAAAFRPIVYICSPYSHGCINTNIEMHIINGFFFDFFAGSFIFEFIDAPHPLQNFESSMRNTFLFYL